MLRKVFYVLYYWMEEHGSDEMFKIAKIGNFFAPKALRYLRRILIKLRIVNLDVVPTKNRTRVLTQQIRTTKTASQRGIGVSNKHRS